MKKISLVLAFALAFFGCSGGEIEMVKKASAKDKLLSSIKDANLTVGKAIDGLKVCSSVKWQYDKASNQVKATCKLNDETKKELLFNEKIMNNLAFDTICYLSDVCEDSYYYFSHTYGLKIGQDEFFNFVKKHCDIKVEEMSRSDIMAGAMGKFKRNFTFTCNKNTDYDFKKTYNINSRDNFKHEIEKDLSIRKYDQSKYESVLDLVDIYLTEKDSYEIAFTLADDKKSISSLSTFVLSRNLLLDKSVSTVVESKSFLNEIFKDLK